MPTAALGLSGGGAIPTDPKDMQGLRVPSLRSRKSRLRKLLVRINASEAALRELTEVEFVAVAKHCAEARRHGSPMNN